MPDVILALVERPETAARVLAAAGRLADLTGAVRINALAIRTPPLATIMPTEQMMTPQDEAGIRAEEQHRADALKAVFDAWAGGPSARQVAAEWIDVEGRAGPVAAEWGRRADYVVLKRAGPRDPEPDRQALHAALFETGRPVLVLPVQHPPGPFGRAVAIAWRDDERTTRAVLAALRWLGRAERVHVLAGAREGAPRPPRLPCILAEHGAAAELHVLPIAGQRVFGEALLAKAHEVGADLLVMGAYVHGLAHRLVLGGVTRHVLDHAEIPVLMRH